MALVERQRQRIDRRRVGRRTGERQRQFERLSAVAQIGQPIECRFRRVDPFTGHPCFALMAQQRQCVAQRGQAVRRGREKAGDTEITARRSHQHPLRRE